MANVIAEASRIDPRLVVPFVTAVRNLFATMVKVQVTIGKPHYKTVPNTSHYVSGVIGFSGAVVGSIAVSFSEQAAMKLVEAFSGMPLELQSPDCADAIGELANMIAGGAKRELGVLASITTPTVVIGKDYTFATLRGVPCIVVPCSTPFGDFSVEVCVKSSERQTKAA